MSYQQLAYAHLSTVVPAFFIGTFLLLARKGTPRHKALGKIYMSLMSLTALITFFMPAQLSPPFIGHFGSNHALSVMVMIGVPTAYISIRQGNVAVHRGAMMAMYIGGLLIAGSLAFRPGRMLNEWLFQGIPGVAQWLGLR